MAMRTSLATVLLSLAGLMGAAGSAHADWCVDLKTGQNYDCAKVPPSGAQPAKPGQPVKGDLEQRLRKSLGQSPSTTVDRQALVDRYLDSSKRADSALQSYRMADGAQEKAQAKRNFEAAMAEQRTAGRQLLESATDPAQKQELAKSIQENDATYAGRAKEAGMAGAQPPTQTAAAPAAPAKPTGDFFSICEAPQKGVTTCYEIGRSGNACQKVYYQAGEVTWRDSQMSTCGAADLAQRDAYFSGQPVGQGAPADPRRDQISGVMASLSPQCQEQVKSFLYGSRDSQSSRTASNTAIKSFSDLQSDWRCKEGLAQLAGILGVEMPQRRLGEPSKRAWAEAMANKPRETVNVPNVANNDNYNYGEGSVGDGSGWNTGEVINTGIQILGILSAVLGGFAEGYGNGGGYSAPTYTTGPARGYGGPSGGGYVYRGNSGGSNSTITGGHR